MDKPNTEWSWRVYLDKLLEDNIVTAKQLAEIILIWRTIGDKFGGDFPVPTTQPRDDGSINLYWEGNPYYFELDIFENGKKHWFGKDRTTGKYDGSEDPPLDTLPDEAWTALARVVGK